jgi:nucleoside-diphosphate-sugar epimerase
VREVVERLFSMLGADSQPQFGSIDDRSMEQIQRADVERQMMGWSPRTSLDEGLRATIAWYRDRR